MKWCKEYEQLPVVNWTQRKKWVLLLPSRGERFLKGGTVATSWQCMMQAVCGKEFQWSPQTVVSHSYYRWLACKGGGRLACLPPHFPLFCSQIFLIQSLFRIIVHRQYIFVLTVQSEAVLTWSRAHLLGSAFCQNVEAEIRVKLYELHLVLFTSVLFLSLQGMWN